MPVRRLLGIPQVEDTNTALIGSECTCYTVFFCLPSVSVVRKRFTSSLLGIYPASIIRHRLMLDVLFDDIILDPVLTSSELLAKLFSGLFCKNRAIQITLQTL